VIIGGKLVTATFVVLRNGLRLRVGVEDWQQLGVHDGETVCVALPGESIGRTYIVRSALWIETSYWLDLTSSPAKPDPFAFLDQTVRA
jgi:hypothetical protein